MIVTPSPDRELPPCAASVTYLREADLAVALRRLREEHGVESIDCEGGPGLNATLVPAGLVDELHLVIAPKLAGGRDPLTILSGDTLDPPADLVAAVAARVRRVPVRPLRADVTARQALAPGGCRAGGVRCSPAGVNWLTPM